MIQAKRAGGSAVAVQVEPASRWAVLWQQRRVLSLLVTRDLKVKYADSLLGYLWSIVEPLLMAGIYWLVFVKIMNRNVGEEPYIVFLLAGMLPWQWVNGAIRGSMKCFSKDSKLVRSTALPREIWVLRVVLTRMSDFLLALPVLAVIVLATWTPVYWQVVFLPLALLLQAVFMFGLGMLLAPLAVLYGDVERLVRLALRLLFFLSPVVYGVHDVRDRLGGFATLYVLNPFAGLLDLYRVAFYPDQWSGWTPLLVTIGFALVSVVVGVLTFRRFEGTVLKEI